MDNNKDICLLAAEVLNDDAAIMHDGQPKQKWYVFGASGATRFQPGAKYARFMTNPNKTEEKTSGQNENEKSSSGGTSNDSSGGSSINRPTNMIDNISDKVRKTYVYGATEPRTKQPTGIRAIFAPKANRKVAKELAKRSTDEIKDAIARLKAENDYMTQLNNRLQLQKDYENALNAPIREREEKYRNMINGVINSFPVRFATNYAGMIAGKEIEKAFGQDYANAFRQAISQSTKGGGGKNQNKNQNKNKNKNH